MEARPDEPFIAQPVPESTAIRNWHIRKHDVEKHGATAGCTACKYVLKGTAHHGPHTIQCRKRIQELIMDTEEGRARMDRALGRAMGRPPGEPPGEGGGEVSEPQMPPEPRRRQLPPEHQRGDLETEDQVPESDRAEFVDRMQALGVARNTTEWSNYWNEHAGLRRDHADDAEPAPPAQKRRPPEIKIPATPVPTAPTPPGENRDRFGRPEKSKGSKRPAEFLPDDPNATTSDMQGNTDNAQTVNEAPVPTGQPMEESPPASSLECGTCMQTFPSRNQLHRHLERWNHAIIDEHDIHPELVDSSEDEGPPPPRARRSRRDVLNLCAYSQCHCDEPVSDRSGR